MEAFILILMLIFVVSLTCATALLAVDWCFCAIDLYRHVVDRRGSSPPSCYRP